LNSLFFGNLEEKSIGKFIGPNRTILVRNTGLKGKTQHQPNMTVSGEKSFVKNPLEIFFKIDFLKLIFFEIDFFQIAVLKSIF